MTVLAVTLALLVGIFTWAILNGLARALFEHSILGIVAWLAAVYGAWRVALFVYGLVAPS